MGAVTTDRILRTPAVLGAAVVIIVAITVPVNQLHGAAVERPTTLERPRPVPNPRQLAAEPAATGRYAYLLSSPDNKYPARWCADTEIRYSVDLSQAIAVGLNPNDELDRLREAFAEWSRASEVYRFRYVGEKRLATVRSNGERVVDIDAIESNTIGVTYVYGKASDAREHRNYLSSAVSGRTAGSGGVQVVSRGTSDAAALVGDRGFVMIDAVDALILSPNGLRRTLYLHEVGHSLGLGHVNHPKSLMHGTLSWSRPDLARGDVAGIQELAAMPCQE